MHIEVWLTFVTATVLLLAVPGPVVIATRSPRTTPGIAADATDRPPLNV